MLRATEDLLVNFCLDQAKAFDAAHWAPKEDAPLKAELIACVGAYLKTTSWYPRAQELKELPTPADWLSLAKQQHLEVPRFKQRLQHGLRHAIK